MNIYMISRPEDKRENYWELFDTAQCAMVVAANEEGARLIHPDGDWGARDREEIANGDRPCWIPSDQVIVTLVGTTTLFDVGHVFMVTWNGE